MEEGGSTAGLAPWAWGPHRTQLAGGSGTNGKRPIPDLLW